MELVGERLEDAGRTVLVVEIELRRLGADEEAVREVVLPAYPLDLRVVVQVFVRPEPLLDLDLDAEFLPACAGRSLLEGRAFDRTAIVPRPPCVGVARLPLAVLVPAWARFDTPPTPTGTRSVPPI
ncbi:MAG: hypothetical protein V5A62_11520 [Haloarculaceae archaeon]